eukprot:TRINITY_DN31060_c0_g1_i1.p1 TRINITY_DN31060_c0_g1~~TRINITY_DN31060_c0_g1_i1.p1  ORF type:complete len:500 (+),score=78.13 TRINITY_DN31060_c0_g1_i1:114-1613(+)
MTMKVWLWFMIAILNPKETKIVQAIARPPDTSSSAGSITSPVRIRGNFLYDTVTGKRFFAKGIAYNPRNINWDGVNEGPRSDKCVAGTPKFKTLEYTADVAADEREEEFKEHLPIISKLGANTIRLYNIDPNKSHRKFMELAAKLGIYVLVPLTQKDWGFLPAFPAPDCYERVLEEVGHVGVNLLRSAKMIVKEFSQYPNTLAFIVANEMPINDKNGYSAYPCVKALTRDMHRYQASCGNHMRRVPLMYADMDMGPYDRALIAQYLMCELESPDDAVDMYGLNVYSWCDQHYLDNKGKDNFQWSPYKAVIDDFGQINKPFMLAEFGCNHGVWETACPYPKGREWPQVSHIFGKMGEMTSGAIAFEYSQEKNQFGIVLTAGFLKGQSQTRLLPSYHALQKAFKENDVETTWDGIDLSKCDSKPSDAAKLKTEHQPARCTSRAKASDLQRRKNVDMVVDWYKIPEHPDEPAFAKFNATDITCPSYHLSASERRENCCHFSC